MPAPDTFTCRGGTLRIEPVEELNVLRLNHRKRNPFTLAAGKKLNLKEVRGDSLELGLVVDMKKTRTFVIKVRCSPDSDEETPIIFDSIEKEIRIDTTRSSLRKDIRQPWPHPLTAYRPDPFDDGRSKENVRIQKAPLELSSREKLNLRIYLDRSILEVFANGRQCITQRIYPSRTDSLGVVLSCSGGDTQVSLDAWDMASAN